LDKLDEHKKEKINAVLAQVMEECERARAKHRGMVSTHEAHGVILEELEEWWDSVKADTPDDKELLSVAAMAVLAIVELKGRNVVPLIVAEE
jgi:chromosome segregation and condensation protein ScpB